MTDQKQIISEIILEKNYNIKQPDCNDFDAVFTCITKMDNINRIIFKEYDYMVNTKDPISVADNIMFQFMETRENDKHGKINYIKIRLYSEVVPIRVIKEFIFKCRQDYESQRNNKLGDHTYFFDQVTSTDTRFHNALSFDKKLFQTDKTFENVFFEEKKVVAARVQHFRSNREWYRTRGIPYTLGFMFTGPPGTGKTSTIKAIANMTQRHIINVKLSEIKTKTQLKNLFYNPLIQIVNPENLTTEKYNVSIHKRLYVIEDIDCMTTLVQKREPFNGASGPGVWGGITDSDQEIHELKQQEITLEKELGGGGNIDGYDELILLKEKIEALKDRQKLQEQEQTDSKNDAITLDDLLNILDGTLEIPDRMFCITTNRPEMMDPALIRPGRVDMIVKFNNASREIIQQMFENFYDEDFDIELFQKIKNYKVSPARVHQVTFKYFSDPHRAIEEIVVLSNRRKLRLT